MSEIILFGASGAIGSAIAAELIRRGHAVTGVSRSGTSAVEGLRMIVGDASDARRVAEVSEGSDVIASAIGPRHDGTDDLHSLSSIAGALLDGARLASVRRLVVVGGAGSLIESDGTRHVDTKHFKPEYRDLAIAHARSLDDVFSAAADLDWTYVSPAEVIFPGDAVGTFRTENNCLVRNSLGEHQISTDDYAMGFADTIENGTYLRQQINFAY